MKIRMVLLLGWFVATGPLSAHTRHAPLSPKLLEAKTACIDNRTGEAQIADRAYDELQKWGRFQVVPAGQRCDVVFLFTTQSYVTGAYHRGSYDDDSYRGTSTVTRRTVTFLNVVDPQDGTLLWSNSKGSGNLYTGFRSATRGLIKDLRKRTEEKN
jgi:hypothetical protein